MRSALVEEFILSQHRPFLDFRHHGHDLFTKISGNFGLTEWIGLVQPEKFRKNSPPFEVDHFFRLDQSDRNGPFHLTIPTHSQSQDLAVRYLPCTKWGKILITVLWWINSWSIAVTRTYMYSYHRSVGALHVKCMFWLLTALKDDLFPVRIWNVVFRHSIWMWCLKSSGKYLGMVDLLKMARYTG